MLKKGSKLYSVAYNKCPQCHEGRFFKYAATLNLKRNLKVYDNCENCGLKYMIEPSFFYGAMYVSYALTVGLAIVVFIISYVLGLDLIESFIAILIVLLVTTPLTMRISRLLYINLFVHFKK